MQPRTRYQDTHLGAPRRAPASLRHPIHCGAHRHRLHCSAARRLLCPILDVDAKRGPPRKLGRFVGYDNQVAHGIRSSLELRIPRLTS
jgi:hypothetical protein